MEGIRKYKEIYKNGIELGFTDLYNELKKEDISKKERLKRLKILVDNNLWKLGKVGGVERNEWINKEGYILSKKIEYIIWEKINEDNHKIFGDIGVKNIIDKEELKIIETLVLDKKGKYKEYRWDEKYKDLVSNECLFIDTHNECKFYRVYVKVNKIGGKIISKEVIVEDY